MFTEITVENFTDIFNNNIIYQLGQINCSKNGIYIDVYIDRENMTGYIETIDNRIYKFFPPKITIQDTISKIFNVTKENIMLTTYFCEKGRSVKSLTKLKSWSWKMILDNLGWIKLSFMYY